ncbi:MAG TPA: MoxR family ATPase, partial [Acidimicrobiales bacterium]|nr:MoxR family ATPase [Acidimicrobiales bacterium]
MRGLGLYKPPGVAETIVWAEALAALGRTSLDEDNVEVTLGSVLKYREDAERVRTAGVGDLVREAMQRAARS